jgi:hypothetical protein
VRVGTQLDIQQIAERAREFHARMKSVKASIAPRTFEWYPYDSRANNGRRELVMERCFLGTLSPDPWDFIPVDANPS